jgi:hypothetical protein
MDATTTTQTQTCTRCFENYDKKKFTKNRLYCLRCYHKDKYIEYTTRDKDYYKNIKKRTYKKMKESRPERYQAMLKEYGKRSLARYYEKKKCASLHCTSTQLDVQPDVQPDVQAHGTQRDPRPNDLDRKNDLSQKKIYI